MEKAKKWFVISLSTLIVFLVINVISIIFPIIYPITRLENVVVSIILIYVSGIILLVSFTLTFYFYLKLKEIRGTKVFLTWLITSLIWFIYWCLFMLLLSHMNVDFYRNPFFVTIIQSIVLSLIIGIIALTVYFKNRKKTKQRKWSIKKTF